MDIQFKRVKKGEIPSARRDNAIAAEVERLSRRGSGPFVDNANGVFATGGLLGKRLVRATETVLAGSVAEFAPLQSNGDKGDEEESGATIQAYVREGCVIEGCDYKISPVCGAADAIYEVDNPSIFVRGYASADVSSGSASTTFTILKGAIGSETSTGVTIPTVQNTSSCDVKGTVSFPSTAQWMPGDWWQFSTWKSS